ncbi:MAG: flagellar protein FlaG [Desulfobacterales bacterium]|nr:flagellar protein FlaG [Desulfobacterales bacterium]
MEPLNSIKSVEIKTPEIKQPELELQKIKVVVDQSKISANNPVDLVKISTDSLNPISETSSNDLIAAKNPGKDYEIHKNGEVAAAKTREFIKETTEEPNKKIEKMAEAINDYLIASDWSVKIMIHEETNQTIVQIVSNEGKVLKQLPPDELINLAQKMIEFAGMLVDKKV